MARYTLGTTPPQHMLEGMHLRKLATFLERSPDTATATAEDFGRFQLHLVRPGYVGVTLNATIRG